MQQTNTINYEGVDYEIKGDYEQPEEDTGYKGGFVWMQILINDMDVSNHLKDSVIDKLVELVIEQND